MLHSMFSHFLYNRVSHFFTSNNPSGVSPLATIHSNTNLYFSAYYVNLSESFQKGVNPPFDFHNDESEALRTSARGFFITSAKPAEAHPPSLKLRRISFSHSSPSFWT